MLRLTFIRHVPKVADKQQSIERGQFDLDGVLPTRASERRGYPLHRLRLREGREEHSVSARSELGNVGYRGHLAEEPCHLPNRQSSGEQAFAFHGLGGSAATR